MGDIADMMLDGTLCDGCGCYLNGTAPGYPRYCRDCTPKQQRPAPAGNSTKVACPTCGKRVKRHGLDNHMRDAHKPKDQTDVR